MQRRQFLKTVMAGSMVAVIPSFSRYTHGLNKKKPNIVLIMADDIGQGDIGFYHRQRTGKVPVVETPNLDQMIKDGIRFNDAHSPQSLCAPTRFSMMTGNYSYRSYRPFGSWVPWDNPGIEPQYTTSARIARKGGYATAFLGKWGLGGEMEKKNGKVVSWGNWEDADFTKIYKAANYHGFDYSCELPSGIQNVPFAFYENSKWMPLQHDSRLTVIGPEQNKFSISRKSKTRSNIGDSNWDPTKVGNILVHKAVNFIKKHVSENSEKPFFMYYCSQAVHLPHTPPRELGSVKIAGSTPGVHCDMIRELDVQVGMIIKSLKSAGVYEKTLLVFTSDNGGLRPDPAAKKAGHDSSGGCREFKGSIYEGGHLVPFIAVWPGEIAPNTESNEPIVGHDMVATIAGITGYKDTKNKIKDSLNLIPLLTGQANAKGHDIIIHQKGNIKNPHYAIRQNDWKLIMKAAGEKPLKGLKPIALFNIKNNPFEDENKNLISDKSQKKRIDKMFTMYKYLRKTGKPTVRN